MSAQTALQAELHHTFRSRLRARVRLPGVNTLSHTYEIEANRYSLETVNLFYTHPSVARRVRTAKEWRAAEKK